MDERSIDKAPSASLDMMALNKTVVNARSVVKKAKTHLINKLVRNVTDLKKKKGSEQQKEKNLKKAQRFLEEIDSMRTLKDDKIFKYALANVSKFEEVAKSTVSPAARAMARLADHRLIQELVQKFRKEQSDWRDLAAFMLMKQTGRKFKTAKQLEKAKGKKGRKEIEKVNRAENIKASKLMTDVYAQGLFREDDFKKAKETVESDSKGELNFLQKRRLRLANEKKEKQNKKLNASQNKALNVDNSKTKHNTSDGDDSGGESENDKEEEEEASDDESEEESDESEVEEAPCKSKTSNSKAINKNSKLKTPDLENASGSSSSSEEEEEEEEMDISNDSIESDESKDREEEEGEGEVQETMTMKKNGKVNPVEKKNSAKDTVEPLDSKKNNRKDTVEPLDSKKNNRKDTVEPLDSKKDNRKDTVEPLDSKKNSGKDKLIKMGNKNKECVVKRFDMKSIGDDSDEGDSSNEEENESTDEEEKTKQSKRRKKSIEVPKFLTEKIPKTKKLPKDSFFEGGDDVDSDSGDEESEKGESDKDDNDSNDESQQIVNRGKIKSMIYNQGGRGRFGADRGRGRGRGRGGGNSDGQFKFGGKDKSGKSGKKPFGRGGGGGDDSGPFSFGSKEVVYKRRNQTIITEEGTTKIPKEPKESKPKLHPSWEASRKRKAEMSGGIKAFAGQRISFDD